jgi:DNA glycosylase AlkZ-like
MPPTLLRLDPAQVRTIRLACQGMVSTPNTDAATVVRRFGFVRTLGGAEAYLSVRARRRTLRRFELERCVDNSELQVIPALRGCIYLVPRADVPLCLRIAEQLSAGRNQREHQRAGIKRGELDRVAELAYAAVTSHGPLTTDALRKTLPARAVRSLGEAGKKVGISSPLPPALRQLEFAGRIERTPEGGRLDTERYLWRAAATSPFAGSQLPDDPVELHARLLDQFIALAGVATLREFSAWSGLALRDAKAAVPHSRALPARIAGDTDALATTDAEDLLHAAPIVATAAAFLPFEDNLVHLFGGPAHLVDAEHLDLTVPNWGRTSSRTGNATTRLRNATHLALRPLIADGRLSGFWEYDPDAKVAVPRCFRKPSKPAQFMIEELSASTSAFLRDEIGHGRSFALDTDDDLRRRLALLRKIGAVKVLVAAKPVAAATARRPVARSAGARKRVGVGQTGKRRARPTTRR